MRYLKNSLAFLLIVIWGLLCFANDASAVNPEKQVKKFIKAAKKKDFKTIFDMSFYYQKSLSEIRSNYPKVLADKKSLEYYESKKNEALKEPDKIPLSWELLRLYRHSLLDSVQGLRYLLDHQCKYKILETKRKTAQDRDEYYDYVQFIVYVSFSSPSVEGSPKFTLNRKSRPIKEIILEFITRRDYGGTVEKINIVKDSWVYWEYEEEVEKVLTIPLEFISIPQGVMVKEYTSATIDVVIKAPRSLIRKITSNDVRAKLNLEKANISEEEYPVDIDVPSGVDIIKISPDKVNIKLAKTNEVMLDIEPNIVGKLKKGLKIEKIEVFPPKVKVKLAESKIKYKYKVRTSPIDISSLTESTELQADLILPHPDFRLVSSQIKVIVRIIIKNVESRTSPEEIK